MANIRRLGRQGEKKSGNGKTFPGKGNKAVFIIHNLIAVLEFVANLKWNSNLEGLQNLG